MLLFENRHFIIVIVNMCSLFSLNTVSVTFVVTEFLLNAVAVILVVTESNVRSWSALKAEHSLLIIVNLLILYVNVKAIVRAG